MTDPRETPRWDRLGPATAARLESAALEILERTGVEVPVREALDLLREAGAVVDGSRVRIPERLVTWALETAPKEITLHDRAGAPAIRLAGRAPLLRDRLGLPLRPGPPHRRAAPRDLAATWPRA